MNPDYFPSRIGGRRGGATLATNEAVRRALDVPGMEVIRISHDKTFTRIRRRDPSTHSSTILAATLERHKLARLVARGRFLEALKTIRTIARYQQLAQQLKP